MTSKPGVVDRIDPFISKASIKSKKQKRSQGSSHYRTKNAPELQALPHLKGNLHCAKLFTQNDVVKRCVHLPKRTLIRYGSSRKIAIKIIA